MAGDDILNKQKQQYESTTILRNNPGMFRDCWVEREGDDWIVVIRQIKFDANGSQPVPKVIRLSASEAWALVNNIQQNLPAI